jgi:uncharacterized OsmC-like protein
MNALSSIPTRVNGIAVDDVKGLIDQVAADPAAGMTRWRVANTWQGQMRSRAGVDGFEIGGQRSDRRFQLDIDEPLELGGSNLWANPQEHLLAALNACMTVGFVALCALEGYAIEALEVVTEGDIDLRGLLGLDPQVAPGYAGLQTTVSVRGAASPEAFQEIFERMLATSPTLHTITQPIAVKPRLVVAS